MDFNSYITGFADGEGCFSVSFSRRAKLKVKIEVRPSFSISQKRYSLKVLEEIHKFFKCGGIRYSKTDATYKYEVRSISDLSKIIIPHFKKYPLITAKAKDFDKFATICKMVSANLHLNSKELRKIIDLAYEMNAAGKRRYQKADLLRLLAR